MHFKVFLLFEFFVGPLFHALELGGEWPCRLYGGGLQHFSVSPRPLWTNWDFELGLTGLGLGLGSLGTKGLGPGLDNFKKAVRSDSSFGF